MAAENRAATRVPLESACGIAPGEPVVIRVPSGETEVDGVADGTRGVYRGLARARGRHLAAVELRSCDATVFVSAAALTRDDG